MLHRSLTVHVMMLFEAALSVHIRDVPMWTKFTTRRIFGWSFRGWPRFNKLR